MASRRSQINRDGSNPFTNGQQGREDMSIQDADALLFGNMDPTVLIAQLRLDGGTQPRDHLDEDTIEEYAEAMRRGDRFPPVTVFFDGQDYWLADGFHRVEAARRAGLDKVRADIKQGTRRDAVLHSVGVNAQHGLRRTNADKRRAVETLLADAEWMGWSDNEIARRCRVSQPFVSSLRSPVSNNGYKIRGNTRRKAERDGTTYTIKTGPIAKAGRKRATPKPAPVQEQESSVTERIMAALSEHGEMGLAHLSRVSGLSYNDFNLLMDDLIEDGWIEKRIDPKTHLVMFRALVEPEAVENSNAVGNSEQSARVTQRAVLYHLLKAAAGLDQLGEVDDAEQTRQYAQSCSKEWGVRVE